MTLKFSAMVAVSALLLGAAFQPALAQGLHPHWKPAAATSYYDLPTRVRITPGMARIIGPRSCDRSYPMDEWMSCGTATGGPVGGRGS